jgi:hypothetical protein
MVSVPRLPAVGHGEAERPSGRRHRGQEMRALVPVERIERAIQVIREQQVMLAADLTERYEVETKAFVRAVKRHLDRFPEDFMFQLPSEAFEIRRSQLGTSSQWGGRRYAPDAFSEQGVPMRSSVLSSQRAVQVNVETIRAFGRLRQLLSSHADLVRKLVTLEKKYDAQFKVIFEAIRQLMTPPAVPPKRGGLGSGHRTRSCRNSRAMKAYRSVSSMRPSPLESR